MAQETVDKLVRPVDKPVICNPFREPDKHIAYLEGNPVEVPGRRSASYWYKVGGASTTQQTLFAPETQEALPLINLLRDDVRRWRDGKYEGATPVTKKLLEHWNREDRERKLFFCQREAVEAVIYINEILASGRKTRWNTKLSSNDFDKLSKGIQPHFADMERGSVMQYPRLVDIPNEAG